MCKRLAMVKIFFYYYYYIKVHYSWAVKLICINVLTLYCLIIISIHCLHTYEYFLSTKKNFVILMYIILIEIYLLLKE